MLPASIASFCVIVFSIKGLNALLLISLYTGCIINIVKNNANPISIWFGIDCCAPNAFFKNENTTIILVKDVIIIIIEGNNVKIVSIINNFILST